MSGQSAPPTLASQPPEFVQRGKVLVVQRQYQEAVRVCRIGLLGEPACVQGRLVLSMALMALGRFDEVLAEMRVARELEPENPMAQLLRGEALMGKGQYAAADEALQTAQALDPHNAKVERLLEELARKWQDGEDAEEPVRTATKVYPSRAARSISSPDITEDVALESDDEAASQAGMYLSFDEDDSEEGTDLADPPHAEGAEEGLGSRTPVQVEPPQGIAADRRPTDLDVPSLDDEVNSAFDGDTMVNQDALEWNEPTVVPDEDTLEHPSELPPLQVGAPPRPTASGAQVVPLENSGIYPVSTATDRSQPRLVGRLSGVSAELAPLVPPPPGSAEVGRSAGGSDWLGSGARGPSEPTIDVDVDSVEREIEGEEHSGSFTGQVRRPIAVPSALFSDSFPVDPVRRATTAVLPEAGLVDGTRELTASAIEMLPEMPPLPFAASHPGAGRAPALLPGAGAAGYLGAGDDEWDNGEDLPRPEATRSEADGGEAFEPRARSRPLGDEGVLDPYEPYDGDDPSYGAGASAGAGPSAGYIAARAPSVRVSEAPFFSQPVGGAASFDPERGEPADDWFDEALPAPEAPPFLDDGSAGFGPDGDLADGDDDATPPHRPGAAWGSDAPLQLPEEAWIGVVEADPGDSAGVVASESPEFSRREPGYPAMEPGYSAMEPGYPAMEPGYSAMEPGYQPRDSEFSARDDSDNFRLEAPSLSRPEDVFPSANASRSASPSLPLPAMDTPAPEWVDDSGPLSQFTGAPLRGTAELDGQEDERFLPFAPADKRGTGETAAASPRPRRRKPLPAGASPFEDISDAPVGSARSRRGRAARPIPQDRTSWITLILGDPGRQRWTRSSVALGIVLLALAGGFVFRYLRIGQQLERKESEAAELLRQGNIGSYRLAARRYDEIARGQRESGSARWLALSIQLTIPFEFGDVNPLVGATESPGGGGVTAVTIRILRQLSAGRLKDAEKLAFDARKVHPESGRVHYLAGRIALFGGHYGQALAHLERARRLSPDDCLLLAALGDAHLALGALDPALASYERALSQNGRNVRALLGKARQGIAAGGRAEADILLTEITEGRYREFASRGQRGWAFALRAKIRAREGEVEVAKGLIDQAYSNAPVLDPLFYETLAETQMRSFRLGAAERSVARAIELMPGRPQPTLLRAQIFLLQGRAQSALKALDSAGSANQQDAAQLLRTRVLLRLGRVADARKVLSGGKSRRQGVKWELLEAEVALAEGQLEQAEAKLRALLARRRRDPHLWTALGDVQLRRGQLDLAERSYKKAISSDNSALGAKLKLADVYLRKGATALAVRSLVEEARKNRWYVPITRRLAELDLGSGRLAEAKTALAAVLEALPSDATARLTLVRVLTMQRDFERAADELKKVAGASPSRLALARGRLALRQGQAAEAVAALRAASKEGGPAVLSLLAQAHEYSGDLAAANAVVAELRGRYPKAPETLEAEARALLAAAQPARAVAVLKTAIARLSAAPRLPRYHAQLYVLLGRALQDAGQTKSALTYYGHAKDVCKSCPNPSYRLALALDELGQQGQALNVLAEAIRLAPWMPEYHYELGRMHADAERRSEAIQAFRVALSLKPSASLRKDIERAQAELR